MSLDPRNLTYRSAPSTPEMDRDDFSFARPDYSNHLEVGGSGNGNALHPIGLATPDEEDANSIYTLNDEDDDDAVDTDDADNTNTNTLYDLPTHISSHGGPINNSPNSPQTMPSSPVGTPFRERPTHPLRALTATNLVLNQQNGTDESLIASSPVQTSTLRHIMALDDLEIVNSGSTINDTEDEEEGHVQVVTVASSQREAEWQERGAAVAIKTVKNDDGEDEDVIIRRSVKDFKFGKTLGIGSYSTVILATDKNTRRQFAVKVLDKRHIIREKKVKYVNIEKNTLSRLGKRDGIVHMYFTFQDESSLYFVLDYATNGELLALIKEHGTLNQETTMYYAAQLLDAIKYMHDNGVIHRDLKPENILLDANMKLQVTDFGTAKLMEKDDETGAYPADTRSKSFVGTAEYVSPELLNEKAVGKPCDIWAFGCILYQMIAGRPPFKATNEYLTFQKIVKLQYAFTAGFPMVVRDLIKKILVLHPNDRLSIRGIQKHLFFQSIDFRNPQKSIWNVPPPTPGPYKVSAKSMLPVPELQNQQSRTRITIPRRSVSTPSTPLLPNNANNRSSDSVNSTPPATAATATQTRESQQVLMRAKANIAARKQKESQRAASGAAGAAALALSRQPNDIIKAYNDKKDRERERQRVKEKSDLDLNTPPMSASSNVERGVVPSSSTTTIITNPTHSASASTPLITTLRKKPVHSSNSNGSRTTYEKKAVPPMSKLDLEFIDYLKDSEERVLRKGDINVQLTNVETIEKKYKRRLVDAPLGGNKTGGLASSSMLSQVANGSYRGLRNMDKHGEEAEKYIITNHNLSEMDDGKGSARTRFKKFFSGGSGEDEKRNRLLVVTSNGRALIFNKLDQDGDDEGEEGQGVEGDQANEAKSDDHKLKLELRTEISLSHPVIKVKELLPSSTSHENPSLFVIESYSTAFVFESTQTDVSNWTQTIHKARLSSQEKLMQKRLEQDPSGDAGTVLGSEAAKSAATIVTSPKLIPAEFPPVTKTTTTTSIATRSSTSSTRSHHTQMLKDMVHRKAPRSTPKEVPDNGKLYHGLPMSLLTSSSSAHNNGAKDPLIAAAEAAIVSNAMHARQPVKVGNAPSSSSSSSSSTVVPKHITGMNSRLLSRSVRSTKSKK